ncbi:uncharacterized protein TRAVEDRAFT_36427 [Trametes versicolor FP-101664 SS1]|uniref:uncharacterized protein n=1 Tax=Trametes versicolor (strain FP-101664) TaxID=717944 RepID=UPI00046237FE|nr:uncharacterized protein TRAVEDRAFT_36427 [Trametes versicolor FP-101664 SS1]EIW60841.1 hypothetical protein TRAVEDRAFT_36427 [Trametes versicolor FP-101664 SS1]
MSVAQGCSGLGGWRWGTVARWQKRHGHLSGQHAYDPPTFSSCTAYDTARLLTYIHTTMP